MTAGTPRLLVVGVGNRERGDDAVGPAVLAALAGRLPSGALAITPGDDLLGLIDRWRDCPAVLCIDAALSMGATGRMHRLDLDRDVLPALASAPTSTHGFGLPEAIALASALGSRPARLIVFAIEGEAFEPGEPLSPRVAEAVPVAAESILCEVVRLLAE